MRHKTHPHFGVQFHPESICSEFGETLYRNFVRLAADHWHAVTSDAGAAKSTAAIHVPKGLDPSEVSAAPSTASVAAPGAEEGDGPTKLLWMKVPGALASIPGGTEALYWGLHGGAGAGRPGDSSAASVDSFWLDSATAATAPAEGPGCPRSRFSYMGGRGGALWRRVIYKLPPPQQQQQQQQKETKAKNTKEGEGESKEGEGATDPASPDGKVVDGIDGGKGEGEGEDGGVAWRTGAPPPFHGGRLEVEDSAGCRRVTTRTSLMG